MNRVIRLNEAEFNRFITRAVNTLLEDYLVDGAVTYSPADFDNTDAPEELIQYVIDNVANFGPRYRKALSVIGKRRCPLRLADSYLYDDIMDAVTDWCADNGDEIDNYDIDEIFDI